MKQLLLILLLTLTTLFAQDARLEKYPQALEWEKTATVNADSAYNLGYIYQTKIKDNEKAIELYNLSYNLKKSSDTANNLGAAYEHIKNYKEAIKWYKISSNYGQIESLYNIALLYDEKLNDYKDAVIYYKKAIKKGDKDAPVSLALLYKKAYEMENMGGAHGLGYLYKKTLNDDKKAELWFKRAIQNNYTKSYGSLGALYHKQHKDNLASAYMIALIDNGYSKSKILGFLRTKWKLTNEELKEAYKLQQTLDIPKHYTGGID